MIRYANKSGYSDVNGFMLGKNFIRVQFNDGVIRTYNYRTAGEQNVENMNCLALRGEGLGTYFFHHTAYRYVK